MIDCAVGMPTPAMLQSCRNGLCHDSCYSSSYDIHRGTNVPFLYNPTRPLPDVQSSPGSNFRQHSGFCIAHVYEHTKYHIHISTFKWTVNQIYFTQHDLLIWYITLIAHLVSSEAFLGLRSFTHFLHGGLYSASLHGNSTWARTPATLSSSWESKNQRKNNLTDVKGPSQTCPWHLTHPSHPVASQGGQIYQNFWMAI